MATKLVQTLADDNPDLRKQIGCMTGIFQLFDRQQLVAGRRYGHRRLLLPANPRFSNGSVDREYNGTYLHRHADEPNHFVGPNERQQFSTESSRASITSSCSSSLSSWECGISAQPELSPLDSAVFSEALSSDPVPKQSGSSSPNLGRKSMGLRDVVKDSMYREAGRGSLQVKPKEPRKADYRNGLVDMDNVPADIKESLKALAKLRESQGYCNDARQLPRSSSTRDQSCQLLTKDAPRFSYDGREQMHNRFSFESRDTIKSSMKLKELPRLSFDNSEGSFQSLHSSANSNVVQKSTEKAIGVSNEKRPPSVVAKLMGLEALPVPSSANENTPLGSKKPDMVESFSPFLRASKRNEMNGHIRGSSTPGGSLKEPESPRWRNPDGTIRPMPRVANESAPWRQTDGNRNPQKPGQKSVKVLQKTGDGAPSVYGEIEKRLKDLEFKQSGKDLRALKQILEAIQAKGLLETRKEDQVADFGIDINTVRKSRQISRLEMHQLMHGNHSTASTSRGSEDVRAFESRIVIIKPSKLIEKDGFVDSSIIPIEDLSDLCRLQAGVPADTRKSLADWRIVRDQAPKPTRKESMGTPDRKINSRNGKPNQISSGSQSIPKENYTLPKNSSSVSPRLQQKKLELERRARPPSPPSYANKSKRISNRKACEVASSGGRNRVKHSNPTPCEDLMSEVSNDSRTPSYQGDDISVHSDGTNFLGMKLDIEDTSQNPSAGSVQLSESKSMQMDASNPLLDDDEAFPEFPTAAPEHHSPVSVLDLLVHVEDDPAPVKMMQNSFRGISAHVSSHDLSEDPLDVKIDVINPPPAPEINGKKLQNIERLVQKLRRVNSTHDEESTDYIASLCENSDPDHRYISEILLASGLLLRDLGSGPATFQLHSSGQAINPELFFVLEQTKSSGTVKEVPNKIHRKLIFDAVNEILTDKLTSMGIPEGPLSTNVGSLARKTLKAQKLLKELCTEIEMVDSKDPCTLLNSSGEDDDGLKGIPWEDAVRRTGSWTEFWVERSGLVLGIERLIFKDLVSETLVGLGTGARIKPSRRRALFGS
ncbi:hypothetical protein MLD38_028038 [Melastoma candidum]|uniref:Uncharacterized protein n=1 Tax=Melastoma candidum TaxID=119954 RepID=A0ACB9MZY2_9MYRT|nr:hypothetical protein MLD38_028038 [Melastoma candidum]